MKYFIVWTLTMVISACFAEEGNGGLSLSYVDMRQNPSSYLTEQHELRWHVSIPVFDSKLTKKEVHDIVDQYILYFGSNYGSTVIPIPLIDAVEHGIIVTYANPSFLPKGYLKIEIMVGQWHFTELVYANPEGIILRVYKHYRVPAATELSMSTGIDFLTHHSVNSDTEEKVPRTLPIRVERKIHNQEKHPNVLNLPEFGGLWMALSHKGSRYAKFAARPEIIRIPVEREWISAYQPIPTAKTLDDYFNYKPKTRGYWAGPFLTPTLLPLKTDIDANYRPQLEQLQYELAVMVVKREPAPQVTDKAIALLNQYLAGIDQNVEIGQKLITRINADLVHLAEQNIKYQQIIQKVNNP